MEAPRIDPESPSPVRVDWEAFYRNYRKPGYLPGFEIVNKLGGGMFGLVFKARKESIGKDYAVKFLKVDDDTVRDAVMREIDNVSFFAQIDHPNLVSIEDLGTVDGIPYLVMSYAGEDTLQKRLQAGDLDREAALHVFVQAARGVQALHDHSLVHFDLKPANIFLKGDVARVGDYGLSKLVSASRNSLSFGRGTPYYMAPEMLQRRGDARSDVYSLGIILYECLYGEVPFRGDSEWEVLRKHETAQVTFPPHALREDREVILRCLQKKPEDRFQTAADLLRALQAPVALGESMMIGELAPPPPTPAPAPPTVPPPLPVTDEPDPAEVEASAPPRPNPVDGARGAESPRGMPWQQPQDEPPAGVVSFFVRAMFTLIEAAVRLVMLPVRAVSAFANYGIIWLLRLPFRLLGFLVRVIGMVLVVAIIVLVIVTVFALLAAV
ncbi:MAG: serine/threonine protein kinase [Planctomycetes bacterium]|nr:serine/threonine protein kinase [Planctomycetota bacterium]